MFNGTGGQGVGNFIAKDTTVREVRTTKKQKKHSEVGDAAVAKKCTTGPAAFHSTCVWPFLEA